MPYCCLRTANSLSPTRWLEWRQQYNPAFFKRIFADKGSQRPSRD